MRISFYNQNTAKNAIMIRFAHATFYFSYNTLVGLDYESDEGFKRVVQKNRWAGTTGMHLNWIDGGDSKARVTYDVFQTEVDKCLHKYGYELPEIDI